MERRARARERGETMCEHICSVYSERVRLCLGADGEHRFRDSILSSRVTQQRADIEQCTTMGKVTREEQ